MSKKRRNSSFLTLVSKCRSLGAKVVEFVDFHDETDSWLVLFLTFSFDSFNKDFADSLFGLIVKYGRPSDSLPDFEIRTNASERRVYVSFPLKDFA